MAVNTRAIKRRIKSIGNTKKITKAMELVSASKMRRAVNAVLSSRPYATLAWETVAELSKFTDPSLHPLLARREPVKKILIVLITSDRGLCGGFNTQILKKTIEFVRGKNSAKTKQSAAAIDFIAIGKKGQDAARRLGFNIVATFVNLSHLPTILEIQPLAALVTDDFKNKIYDQVFLAYTDFVSSLKQIPQVKQLLPFSKIEGLGEAMVGKSRAPLQSVDFGRPEETHYAPGVTKQYIYEYLFEPSPAKVLEIVLPRLIETQIYQAIVESSASEQSARMVSMKNATESAVSMIDDLVFTLNQARQASITREIAEISAGKAALE